MTVKELIEKLQMEDPNSIVAIQEIGKGDTLFIEVCADKNGVVNIFEVKEN